MNKKVIMLTIALICTMTDTLSAPIVSFTIPGQAVKTVDINTADDSIAADSLLELAQEKSKKNLPLIFAVVPASGGVYHYFDAESLINLYKSNPATMLNPNNRQPIANAYFFQLAKPTDTQATYFCSNKEILTADRDKLSIYEPIFTAYGNDNKNSFDTAMKKIPRVPAATEKRFKMPGQSTYDFIKITDKDPVSGQQIQVLMNQKTAKGLSYILAVAVTLDQSGKVSYTLYDPSSIEKLYKENPGYAKPGISGYSMINKANGKNIYEVFYFTLKTLSDPDLSFLCTGQEILTGNGQNASLYKAVLTANQSDNKAAYDTAFARLPKY